MPFRRAVRLPRSALASARTRLTTGLLAVAASAAFAATAAPADPAPGLPSRWDWREHGMVTPVKAVGACSPTWCFAATAAVESMLLIHEGRALDLAEQQILACATPGLGCHGGWMDEAYRFMRDEGVAAEACFPYTGSEAVRCADRACPPVATLAGWADIPADVASLKAAVWNGPVTTTLQEPLAFLGYDGSFCIPAGGPATTQIQAVTIIGWDDALCGAGGWICKSSFGSAWGDAGCFTIAYGAFDIGGHAQRPLYSDGQRVRGAIVTILDGVPGSVGDGDTWPEPGETPLLALTVRNGLLAPVRDGLAARLTMLSGPASLAATDFLVGTIPPGAAGDLQPPVSLAIHRLAAPDDTVRLRLAFTADGAPVGADTLALIVGAPAILVVDDDDGERLETWAAESARRVGYPVRVWEESRRGPVPAAEMRRYRAVVWNEGVEGRLGTDNIVPLADFLNDGGHLFISGQDVAWGLAELGGEIEHRFLADYLQTRYLADDSGARAVAGVTADPLGDGLAFTLGGPGGSGRQRSPDAIEPLPGATAWLAYGSGQVAALRSDARGRLVSCAFGFEAIDQEAARDTLMARVLERLAGQPLDHSAPRVELLAPRGGETYVRGSVYEVRWRGRDDRGIVAFLIEQSFDGGATWPQRLGRGGPADSVLVWTVGDSLGGGQRIRVLAADAAGLWGAATSGPFRVIAPVPPGTPALTVVGSAPNPVRDSARIELFLGAPAEAARVRILDARGRRVRLLVTRALPAGPATIPFDVRDDAGRPLPAGVYAVEAAIPGAIATGRLTVLR